MAGYGAQNPNGYGPRSASHGHSSNFQRDAAFADIFGTPGQRAHTMTSQPHPMQQDRAQTMTGQGPPPMGEGMGYRPPPVRHMGPGYDRGGPPNGHYPPQQPRQMSMTSNGMPPSQSLPQPMYPDRRPYQPQRVDSRAPAPMQQYPTKPPDRRPIPGPALNSDGFRTRSMARLGGPPLNNQPSGPSNSFNQGTASAFRQQPYQNGGRATTMQGRPIPERHDERAMSMSAYARDQYSQQLPSGRTVIGPGRREPTGMSPGADARPAEDPFQDPAYQINGRTRRPSESSDNGRTMSMMSTATTLQNAPSRSDSMQTRSTSSAGASVTTERTVVSKRAPLVYPALLSRVADVFKERIGVAERVKNGLTYSNAFTGQEAVDLISYIIKTADRNLALLLGRALDAQKFFHDVTYDHRLRDAPGEVYRFKETMGEEASASDVNGVFTLLTECYSPTCTRDNLCYSIACPRRLEQQARLNMKPEPGLKHSASNGSLHDEESDEQRLWINSVPKEIAASTDDREKKRQEVISEICYTERDFVKDLEYLRDFWMRPLRAINTNVPSPIPEHRREKFVRTVFTNCLEVLAVNSKFAEALSSRQKENAVVRNIGDVFLQYAPRFDPFIKYGAGQMRGKYEFEREKGQNPAFGRFVDETERLKESRKLELNGYLTKPTTRLARYPLLLDNVLKYTKDDNPDKQDIPVAIALIKDFLGRVNAESGKAENHFNLLQLNSNLKWNAGDFVDLKLTEENRQILSKMSFKKSPNDSSEVTVYLFDHAVLLVRIKMVNKREEYRVYRKPIPLELLVIAEMDQVIPRLGLAKRPSSGLIPGTRSQANLPMDKQAWPITFKHLGRGAYELPLYATSQTQRKKFIEKVEEQQSKLRERNSNFYTKTILCEHFFTLGNRVNCLVPTGMLLAPQTNCLKTNHA